MPKITQCPCCRRVKGIDEFLCVSCEALIPVELQELRSRYLLTADIVESVRGRLISLNTQIIFAVKDKLTEGKPVGYELVIRCGDMPHRREKHWRGTEAACRRKARLESHFIEVESVRPYTSEQWNRAFGVPGLRL